MKVLIKNINKDKAIKAALFIVLMLALMAFSIFCIKKYIKNSNLVQFKLDTFSLSEGFDGGVENDSFVIRAGENEGVNDFCASSSFILLDKGSFTLGISYTSDVYTTAYWQAGDSMYEMIELPAGEQTVFFDFDLEQSVEDARLRIKYPGSGTISINTFVVACDRPIITDWIAILGVGWGLAFVAILYVVIFLEEKMTKKHIFEISIVVAIALLSIPYVKLFNDGIYWGIDTIAQNMRVEGLKDALLEGQFPVVIAPSMCNGYGSIAPIMYPSLFLYPLAILRILGISPVLVYKIAHVVINIFMCSTCYVCVKKITRSAKASSLTLLFFAFSRYHLKLIGDTDWTYGMGIAIIFMFVVIIGVYEITLGNEKSWPYLTFGMWGVMNSHIMSTLFAAFLVIVFSLAFIDRLIKEKRIQYLIKAALCAVPICLYRMYTFVDAYANNDLNTGVLNLGIYDETTRSIYSFFTDDSTIVVIAMIAVSVILIMLVKQVSNDYKRLLIASICFLFGCMLIMSKYLPWNSILGNKIGDFIFGYIQYSDRVLQVAIPVTVVVFGIILKICLDRGLKSQICVSILCVILFAISVVSYTGEIKVIKSLRNSFDGKITGDVLSFPGMDDYVLDGENAESYSGRTPYISSDDVMINYDTYTKNGVDISCLVVCLEDGNYIDFPIFGYKGYVCTDENGNNYKVGVGEHHRLRVYVDGDTSPQALHIRYKVPFIYSFLQILSYVSIFILITFNRHFLSRTKDKIGYYDKLSKIKATSMLLFSGKLLLNNRR